MQRAVFPNHVWFHSQARNITNTSDFFMVVTTIIAGFIQWIVSELGWISQRMDMRCLAVPSLTSITTGCFAHPTHVIPAEIIIPAKMIIATATLWEKVIYIFLNIHNHSQCLTIKTLLTAAFTFHFGQLFVCVSFVTQSVTSIIKSKNMIVALIEWIHFFSN